MRSISVGELRQNPTRMLAEIQAGEVHALKRHNREIAQIVPSASSSRMVPPRRTGRARTGDLPYVELSDNATMDQLLDELTGEW
ncbi:MAG: prevent-host-death family protein [Brachybacterium faecium]|nr:MAG: prevent-host-death family protein [Brachybacterium faecium]